MQWQKPAEPKLLDRPGLPPVFGDHGGRAVARPGADPVLGFPTSRVRASHRSDAEEMRVETLALLGKMLEELRTGEVDASQKREAILDELTAEAQRLGLGY